MAVDQVARGIVVISTSESWSEPRDKATEDLVDFKSKNLAAG